MELTRNKSHEVSMTLVYNALTYIAMKEAVDVEALVSNYFDKPYDECDSFVKSILVKALKNYGTIVSHLEPLMVDWKFARINRLAQAILLIAYTHFYYIKDVEKNIAIDNAVRLSKKFLEEDAYKFINAVLDKAL